MVGYFQLVRTLGLTMLLSAVSSAVGLIPILGQIVSVAVLLYALFVNIVIVKELSGLSMGKSAAAVLLPCAIVMLIGMALAGALVASLVNL